MDREGPARLLIISHAYPPVLNARAFRWSALAEGWAAKGWDVVVITGAFPGAPSRERINGVEVQRVGSGFLEKVRARLAPLPSGGRDAAPTRSVNLLRRWVRAAARVIHDVTWKKLYWPDSTALWITPAEKAAVAVLSKDPDRILVTVSLPFSSHVVGLRIKRKFPDRKWIVDIGDPFSIMKESPVNNHLFYGGRNKRAEKKVLVAADAISVTTAGTVAMYESAFPEVSGKIVEIPPLLVSSGFEARPTIPSSDTIRFVYVGTLHRSVRSPERVLSLFRNIVKQAKGPVVLEFFGNYLECTDMFEHLPAGVRQYVVLHGMVERKAAVAAMANASVLVNIGNETTYQLPSKLVEYASIGKPIINVVGTGDDSSVNFLTSHPCVFTVVGDEASAPATADRALQFVQASAGRGDCAPPAGWLSRFSLPGIASSYEGLFQR